MKRRVALKRLKENFLISITPIPKVYIRVKFRTNGSYTIDFGYKHIDHFKKLGIYWNENGLPIEENHFSFFFGQDYTYRKMWRYIQRCVYENRIHPLELVK